MPRYIAFLRAVNVGGRTVKMDELRGLFEKAGLRDVETFIASGNVVFSAAAKATAPLERTVEAHLNERLGYPVSTFVRTPAEVAAAATHAPFTAREVSAAGTYVVAFLKAPLTADARTRLAALGSGADRFVDHAREVYWMSALRQSESKLTLVQFERAVGGPATMRAMTSLKKLAAKHCG
jgi:uncharacterized protein (DUF1697 family)